MTLYTERLLEEAKDYWSIGMQLPIDLYARLAGEGMDVPRLEQLHLLEVND